MTPKNQLSAAPELSRRSESGSAYLATLLVLVVLTVLGLSLAVITQTEVLIGGSEKQATRQVYAANSAISIATGYEMVTAASQSHHLQLGERTIGPGQNDKIVDDICTSPYFMLTATVCNLCKMNQDDEYVAVQYGVTTVAMRSGAGSVAARRSLGAVIAVEPWKENINGSQMASDERFKIPEAGALDIENETDPCEGLYLKI